MARPLRIEYEGALYHVTSRGNARQPIYTDDADRRIFLETLGRVVARIGWVCHAYCLMTNHYHLLIETLLANLSDGMRRLNGVYTQSFNRRWGRAGHVLQGRFKAILVEKDAYLLELCRYVVLNPVRAKMVSVPEAYRWSNYRATAGKAKAPEFLTTEWVLERFGSVERTARRRYRRFVRDGMEEPWPWEALRGQIIHGTDDFVDRIRPRLEGHRVQGELVRDARYADRPPLGHRVRS